MIRLTRREDTGMLVDMLLNSAGRFGSRVAVADGHQSLNYDQLTLVASAVAKILRKETTSDRVGLMLPASVAFPACLYGVFWLGKLAVPLNFLLSGRELTDIIKDSGVDLVLSVKPFEKLAAELPVRTLFLEDLPLKRVSLTTRLLGSDKPADVTPDETAVLLYTSGTSAKPKGVQLSYRNLHANCTGCIEAAQMAPDHVFLNLLPPFHVFGLTANVLVPAALGATVRAIPRFNPLASVQAIAEHKVSILLAIPSMYGAMARLKSGDRDSLKSIYLAISGGEPLPDMVARSFEEKFGIRLLQGYGMTESSPVISLCAPHAWKDHSVGRPIPGMSVGIFDDHEKQLGVGTDGEIRVQGPCVMRGYYRRPEDTAAVLGSDGWLRTGDIGRLDEDGYLYITGRKKDMMIVGGENVFPREIEAVLEDHPAVADAAVIGVTDESRGEVPVAFVCLKEGQSAEPAALRNFARERLAGYKVPREVHIESDLPRGPTGKILKRELKQRLLGS